jgi:hypothetical protein
MVDNVPNCPRRNNCFEEAKVSESGIMVPHLIAESHFPDVMLHRRNV